MESASDYFGDESRFLERIALSPGQVFRGQVWIVTALLGLGLLVTLVVAGLEAGFSPVQHLLLVLGVTCATSAFAYVGSHRRQVERVNQVGPDAVRVASGGSATNERTFDAREIESAEAVSRQSIQSRIRGRGGDHPFGPFASTPVDGIVRDGISVETTDGSYFLPSRRPDEFAAAVEELVARADRDRAQFGVSTGEAPDGSPADRWTGVDPVTSRDPDLEAESERETGPRSRDPEP